MLDNLQVMVYTGNCEAELMGNITDELAQRLQKVRDERNQLTHRLDRLGQLERAIDLLIKEEDLPTITTRLSPLPVKDATGNKVIGRTELSRCIAKALADGKPRSLSKLVQLAKNESFDFHDKAPKRVLHFALVGLQHNGYAKMLEPSVWQFTEKAITNHEVTDTDRELETKGNYSSKAIGEKRQ